MTTTKKPKGKAKTKPKTKSSKDKAKSPKKESKVDSKGFVKITFVGRKEEAIAEMRSNIQEEDCLARLRSIDEDRKDIFDEILKTRKPCHEDTYRWKYSLSVLEDRSKDALKLLNKLAPDFMAEELLPSESGGKGAIDIEAARDEAFAKLSKVLKPKAKVRNIKDAK